jgi:hypothetical protein
MGFTKRNSNNQFVSLGLEPETDDKGNAREVRAVIEGKLVGIRTPAGFENPVYDFELADDEAISVPGCATINRNLSEKDVGKCVRLTSEGWGLTKRGVRFRQVIVEVDEGADASVPF